MLKVRLKGRYQHRGPHEIIYPTISKGIINLHYIGLFSWAEFVVQFDGQQKTTDWDKLSQSDP